MSDQEPSPRTHGLDADRDARESAELGALARSICGLVAVAAGVAGMYGVFKEGTNTGGVPILLVLAAFFAYLAISGQRLTRLKIGDNEAGFDRVVRAAQRVLEDPAVPGSTKGEVAEALDEVRTELPARARRAVSAALSAQERAETYEKALHEVLYDHFADDYTGEVLMGGDTWDTVLRRPNADRGIFAAARYLERRHVTSKDLAAVLNNYSGDVYSVTGGLIVSNRPAGTEAMDWLDHNSDRLNVNFVVWRGPEDNDSLIRAVQDLLEQS